MAKATFGGDWTEDKLTRLRKYLAAYMIIFTQNPKAQFFRTIYVDAFASTGARANPKKVEADAYGSVAADEDAQAFYKGSAQIALEIEPPFKEYLFIERNPKRCKELEALKTLFPARSIQVVNDDANKYLKEWCRVTDWTRHRSVVFLDPFGMQVEWSLLEAIAQTRAIDAWLLFPIGMGVNRMLTTSNPPPDEWADVLTRVLGTDEWRTEFYPTKTELTLFGEEETQSKDTNFDRIAAYFVKRLKTLFEGVAQNPLLLRNSKNAPLYLLCFASANPKGSKTAITIAQNILKG